MRTRELAAMIPSGVQYELRSGRYRAVVTEVGATMRSLTWDGRPLIRGFAEHELRPVHSGTVLAPWPNRIRDGRYRWDGREYQLPVTEIDRHTALHGTVCWAPWSLRSASADRVVLAHRLVPTPGYPWCLEFVAGFRLAEDGLRVTVSAENVGDDPAPYGVSIHPYLLGGTGVVDDWSLHLRADRVVDVDDDRLLPRGGDVPPPDGLDFREPHRIGDARIDLAYTGVQGPLRASVVDADGVGTAIAWEPQCEWVQVHTADRPEPELNRTGLAVEPMTCPPDAFGTGRGVQRLAPGESTSTAWQLSAIVPGQQPVLPGLSDA